MKRFILNDLLLIQKIEMDRCAIPVHLHDHYELIVVKSGEGIHMVNGIQYPYESGDVFWLGPSDTHGFVVRERTCFYQLSFTDLYIAQLTTNGIYSWNYLKPLNSSAPCLVLAKNKVGQADQQHLLTLAEIILIEQQRFNPLLANPIVESLVTTILSLVDRQLAYHSCVASSRLSIATDLIQRLIAYVCQHIMEPDLLRIEKIADVFNYSSGHLGALFKQQVGESIQAYIIRYKLKLVETRLCLSTMTISEIADEFGFTDVCHLNKLFKRYYQHTPTNYRRGALGRDSGALCAGVAG